MSADTSFAADTPLPSSPDRPTFGAGPVDIDATPAVSIVTPFFNTSSVFGETAASVLRQTLQQWEWIIVNDGSTEPESLAELDRFREADSRIRVIDHEDNRGPGAARNTGYAAARAEFVVQLDSDDQLEPTMLEKLFWFLQSHPQYSFAKGHTVGFGAESYVWVNGFHPNEAFLEANHADVLAMVRRDVHAQVGGYDEANRDGLEDWEFWLKCAVHGYWGGTVHEPLAWYRRRGDHGDRWGNWDGGEKEEAFRVTMEQRFPSLWQGGFPQLDPVREIPYEPIPDTLPVVNQLTKDRPRILMILPWMTVGGADRFNLHTVEQLTREGWDVTIATTVEGDQSWEREFARFTSDTFVLDRFLRPIDYPRFLRYLTGSRSPDVVFVSNSELGYQLLPYLRAHHREPTYIDLSHAEQEDWKSGGHPQFSNLYRDQIDLSIVGSEHLRRWMIDRGGDGSRISVCHLGIDTDLWHPDEATKNRVRDEFGVQGDAPVILFAGRLVEEKQPRVIAETILELHRSGAEFRAIIAGDGPERSWIENFMADNALDARVDVLGRVTDKRMVELFQGADILFLPSEREGIALALMEAMACGMSVVAADVGGQAELVTPGTGVLLGRDTAEREAIAYAKAISELMNDPVRRADMGERARERVVSDFSLDALASRFSSLLERAQDLRTAEPRDAVPVASARASATLAIEYHRAIRIAEGVPSERMPTDAFGEGARDVTTEDQHDPPVASRSQVYGALMGILGKPYRYFKERSPERAEAVRDRVRSLFGYRR